MQMTECELCPRRCRADRFRDDGAPGYCGAANALRLFRWGPHFGEEPPITGERGSGCVFFSRCTMKCLYCQNSPWSWKGGGRDMSVREFADILRSLATSDRVENWNLVEDSVGCPAVCFLSFFFYPRLPVWMRNEGIFSKSW